MCPRLNSLKGYFENTSAIISMLLVIWRNHAALRFLHHWGLLLVTLTEPCSIFPCTLPSNCRAALHWWKSRQILSLVQNTVTLWSDPLCSVLLAVNELGQKGFYQRKTGIKSSGRAQMSLTAKRWFWFVSETCRAVSARLAVALSQLGSWLLLSSGNSWGCEWDLNSLVLNLQPQTPTCNVAWSDLVHCPVLCPVWPEKGRGVPFSVRTLFVRTLQSRRAHWRWWISAIGSPWSPTLGEAWCIFWSVSITNSWVPENCYHLLQVHGGKFD